MESFRSDPHATNLPWFDSPFFEDILSTLDLDQETKAQVRSFFENGFLILEKPLLDDQFISDVTRSLEGKYTHSATGYTEKTRVLDAWRTNDLVKKVATLPEVLKLLEILYQREPIPFQTLNFEKGSQQRAHSDSIHFQSVPNGFMCGVWVALEDIDSENGPLFYYLNSHKAPYYTMYDLGLPSSFQYYQQYEDFIEQLIAKKQWERKEVHLTKGQAIIWSANLLHGGCVIKDPGRTRLSQVTHYFFSNCLYYVPGASDPFIGKMILKEITDIRTGEEIPNIYNGKIMDPRKLRPRLSFRDRLAKQKAAINKRFLHK